MISYVIFPPILRAPDTQPNNIIVLGSVSSVSSGTIYLGPMKGNGEAILIHSVCECVCGTVKNGAPGAIPTRDLSLRRRALYAAELREHE